MAAANGDVKVKEEDVIKNECDDKALIKKDKVEETEALIKKDKVEGENEALIKKEKVEENDALTKKEKIQETPSTVEKQVIRQIEYYFGDINLPRDKFLQDQMKLDDGWIPLEVMLKFKRLTSITTDTDLIVASLQKSADKLMEISEDKRKIRRSPGLPLPVLNEERRKELMSRTLYVKGFPTTDITLDMLLEYFAPHGPIDNINMRSYLDKIKNTYNFKGSVFVMFQAKERAEEFLNKESIKYQDIELIKKWQSVYLDEKRKQRDEHKQNKRQAQKGDKEEEDKSLPKGSVLHLEGFSGDATREEIKEKLSELGADVAFIHFSKGDKESWVRLHGENSTKEVLEKIKEDKLEVCGAEIEARALEGEEETKFLEKAKEDMMQKRRHQSFKNKRGGRRGGGRGGYRGDRKRKGSPTNDEPPVKQVARD